MTSSWNFFNPKQWDVQDLITEFIDQSTRWDYWIYRLCINAYKNWDWDVIWFEKYWFNNSQFGKWLIWAWIFSLKGESNVKCCKWRFAFYYWMFWTFSAYLFWISPANTFEKRQQKQRLALFSKLCSDQNKTNNTKCIQNIQTITKNKTKSTLKMRQYFKSDLHLREEIFMFQSTKYLIKIFV